MDTECEELSKEQLLDFFLAQHGGKKRKRESSEPRSVIVTHQGMLICFGPLLAYSRRRVLESVSGPVWGYRVGFGRG
jgi:hypothetical protein